MVGTQNIREGLLEASRDLRKKGGCDFKANEYYLFHGLGSPTMALNIASNGFNEHFSGTNAGTRFGDGIYLAEDIGKSDQCEQTQLESLRNPRATRQMH